MAWFATSRMSCSLSRSRSLVAELSSLSRAALALGLPKATVLARIAALPRLPELLQLHPQLEIELSSTERRVDIVSECFDCVVRAGKVSAPGLVSRPLPPMPMVNCASPQYLARHGTSQTLDDLAQHPLVHYAAHAVVTGRCQPPQPASAHVGGDGLALCGGDGICRALLI